MEARSGGRGSGRGARPPARRAVCVSPPPGARARHGIGATMSARAQRLFRRSKAPRLLYRARYYDRVEALSAAGRRSEADARRRSPVAAGGGVRSHELGAKRSDDAVAFPVAAAGLIGVARALLQRHIREGQLATRMASSRRKPRLLYPQECGGLRSVRARHELKEEAFGRRVWNGCCPARRSSRSAVRAKPGARRRSVPPAALYALVVDVHSASTPLRREGERRIAEVRAALERACRDLALEPANAMTVMDDVLRIVSAHVTVRPSGREFFVEGRDSLLQAAQGRVKLNYGCGNGTCGCARHALSAVRWSSRCRSTTRFGGERSRAILALRAFGRIRRDVIETWKRRARRNSEQEVAGACARFQRSRRIRCCCTCRRRARAGCASLPARASRCSAATAGRRAGRLSGRELSLRRSNLHFMSAANAGDALAQISSTVR